MDPLSALGLASNIVQFVDYISKLISTTHKLRISPSGTKIEYLELENIALNIQHLSHLASQEESPRSSILSKNDKTLRDLSSQCHEVSNELLSVLKSLEVKGKGERWESFYQALRSEWKKERIQELQLRLDRISSQLGTRVLIDQQSEVLSKIQQLARDNRQLEANRTRDIEDLRLNFNTLFEQLNSGRQETASKYSALIQICLSAEIGKEYAAEQLILGQIRFDAMDYRQIAVRRAHKETFSWIFDSTASTNPPPSASYFVDWLRSDETLFWISGKPGSMHIPVPPYPQRYHNLRGAAI